MGAIRDVFLRQFGLKTKGYYNKNLLAGTYEIQQEALARGTAAMAFQADWILPQIAQRFPDAVDSIGFFPLPSDGGGVVSLYPSKKAAMNLVRYMTKPESLDVWYRWNPGIPVYTTAKSRLFAGHEDMERYVRENTGVIQIQLQTAATYVPECDKIRQEFLIDGDVDKAVRTMDERYREDGENKRLPGF
jgi:ABC-type glycerol-3-phosphate transport system substrate-binding protein